MAVLGLLGHSQPLFLLQENKPEKSHPAAGDGTARRGAMCLDTEDRDHTEVRHL